VSGKVEMGFFSFTEVTDPSEHRSYNEWHQLDHLPEQYSIPGIVLGQRWVCTPACRSARLHESELLGPVHYMTLYLMTEPISETLEEFRALAGKLHDADRFHFHRHSRLSGPFDLLDAYSEPRVLVSAEVLPFRPNRGVYVVVEAREGRASEDGVVPSSDDAHDALPTRLLGQPGVAGIWRFVSNRGFGHFRWRPGNRRVTVCFLDEDPLEVAPGISAVVGDIWSGGEQPELAGPFETVAPWHWDWFDSP